MNDHFLVCGLGSLGQHCVLALKEFGVKIIGIELIEPATWEIPNLVDLLDDLIIGDCRQDKILQQAKITQCRAALLVTSKEQVNIETALAIRQLNPQTRLVVRSAKENLNILLAEQLGNFIAYEPTQLPATAFALAALGTETCGFFTLDGERLRVVKRRLSSEDPWCNVRRLHELNTRNRRLLTHQTETDQFLGSFHQWNPEDILKPGDVVTHIKIEDNLGAKAVLTPPDSSQSSHRNWKHLIKRSLYRLWQKIGQRVRLIAVICGGIILLLLFIGTLLIHSYSTKTTFLSAFLATAILLLGGYSDLFGQLEEIDNIPHWLQFFSLGLTLAGTAFVGVLYALLTDNILSAKFQFVKQRPPVPQQNHTVIIGLGRVGKQVATLLQEFKQTVLGITFTQDYDHAILPKMPLLAGNVQTILPQSHLATAKSVVVVTDDEILNLEIALMAKKINPDSHLVVRTAGQRLGQHLHQILPQAQIIGAYAVAAEVFAGAAFGENIITIFRLDNQTILVTEYEIEAGDTLNELLLGEVVYGYGIVPILHQKPPNPSNLMPSEDIRLKVGDRLIVLATIDGLKCIEQGRIAMKPKKWRIQIESALTPDAAFEGANTIARISGCSLDIARNLMNELPATLPLRLYQHQGLRLVRELSKLRVTAKLTRIAGVQNSSEG